MVYVFFIYGLAFFILGISVALYPKKESEFWFARKLWYVASFGLLHGLNEWVDMFILIHGSVAGVFVQVIRTLLLGSSFFCLLMFGILSIIKAKNANRALLAVPPALVVLWVVIIAIGDGQRFLLADVWGRYLLGAPGIFLTYYALRLQETDFRKAGLVKHIFNLRIAGTAFFMYGFFSGILVPEAKFFPASVVNYTVFLEYTGLPVQAFRAACAAVAAYGMYRLLQVFDWESKNLLKKAHAELEQRVGERTTELVEANKELANVIAEREEAELFNRKILETVDEAFVVIDSDYKIITANRAYGVQTRQSIEEIIGKHCYEISHRSETPCFLAGEDCAVKHTFETGLPYASLHTHHDIQGNPVYVETKAFPLKDSSGKVVRAIETINDVTEKRKLENQLRHSQKLEAIGTLTGGIAHDFNNILTTIIGYGEFLHDEVDKDSPLRTYVDMIVTSAERAATLTQSLLAFSRKQITNPKVISIGEIFKDVEGLLSRVMGEDIELIVEDRGEDVMVKVDRGQIEQVLVNLASNARDAMPGGGLLTLHSELLELDNEFVRVHGYGKPGKFCLISVTDTGVGMDEKTKQQIYEPFFTTKEVGKGTGLGLAVAYGIIRQHNGYINVYSELGEGTTFKIYLPVVRATAEKEEAEEDISLASGTETVLVAEDNDNIRALIKTVLERAGYETIIAVDGEDALRLFRERTDDVHLLLLDVVMPKMDGRTVYEEVKSIREGVKVLFMSGYAENVIHKKGILLDGIDFIAKPVSPKALLRKVREVLDK